MSTHPVAELRPVLFGIAYRMLASVADAEDVVQDAFLRYEAAIRRGTPVESPRAYLSAVVTRLSIDHLRSARHRREAYVGQWLPEPVITSDSTPADEAERADSLSMAFLLVLERLSPVERAVFLLHDVFGYPFGEIAPIVGKSTVHCRKVASRARTHVQAERPGHEMPAAQRDALAARFFAALEHGDVDALAASLAEDVRVYGDGGGKAPQWTRPIAGRAAVAALLAGLARKMKRLAVRMEPAMINGEPGCIFRDRDGRVINTFNLELRDGAVRAIRSVINPDKLRHLGPVADARALLREARAGAG